MSNGGEAFDYVGYRRTLEEFIDFQQKGEQLMGRLIQKSTNLEELKDTLMTFTRFYYTETGLLLDGMLTHVELLEGMNKIVNTLPDRREFDEVRQQMRSVTKKVREGLLPIKEMIEEARKRADRGDELYG